MIAGSVEWDSLFIQLLKRHAKDAFYGLATPQLFSRELHLVYGRTLLLLNLPGGSGQIRPTGTQYPPRATALIPDSVGYQSALRAAARIMILSLSPVPTRQVDPLIVSPLHGLT